MQKTWGGASGCFKQPEGAKSPQEMAEFPPSIEGCVEGEGNTTLQRTHNRSTIGDLIASHRHSKVDESAAIEMITNISCRDEQSNVALALEKLHESHLRLEICSQNQAAQLQTQIMNSLDELKSLVSKGCKGPTSVMADLTSQLSALAIQGKIYPMQLKVIESLRFEMIFERPKRIVQAYPTTFEWLFAENNPVELPGVSVLQWLKAHNGIYWISGKAGSGKSTLMKFLVNDERTRKALDIWAGPKELIIASYFFWNAGTDMQKSQLGLLQTLLYTILQQCAPLVSQICPAQIQKATSSTHSWTRAEILEVLNDLRLRTSASTRFCFFIDGLDEFEGDHSEVLEVMEALASDQIKICFSSRPWNVFQNAYGANCGLKLQLQDINRQDIMLFVEGTLSKDRHFRDLESSDNRYHDLVNEIVERAGGVFLWVFLVVRSLRQGFCNSDTISELQDRLRILPTELEEFFQHILNSTETVYHKGAARLYLMCLSAQGNLTTMTASFFSEEEPNFALARGSYSWTQGEIENRKRDIAKRILARCTDLIEVYKDDQVEFLHRTVHDFLNLRDVHDLLVHRAGDDFDTHQYMCNATLSQLLVDITGYFIDSKTLDGFTPLVEKVLDHAYMMELHSKFTNIQLMEKLDREVERLQEEDANFGFYGPYQKGWLVLAAVQRGLYDYLRQEIGQVRALIRRDGANIRGRGDVTKIPLLDFALQPMADPVLPTKYIFCPDSRVVSLLLENGADPNCVSGEMIWKRLTTKKSNDDKKFVNRRLELSSRRTNVKIIEILLMHGADLLSWDNSGDVERKLFSCFTFEEAAHLKSILNTTRSKRQLSHLVSSEDHPSKRPSRAAVQAPDSSGICEIIDLT